MVSCTGDWTANTPEVEFPAVRAIYSLYGAQNKVSEVQIDAPPNYNPAEPRGGVRVLQAPPCSGGKGGSPNSRLP